MSVVSIETAAISKSRLTKGFNGDSINLNRRISSIDEMNSGYRAAGTVNPPCVCAVVSSVIKGVSAGAVTAFDDYSHRIYTQRTNAYDAFKKYADDMTSVSAECGDTNISIACVCIFSDRILVSSVGNAKIFFCRAGKAQLLSSDGEFMFKDLTDVGADGGYIAVFGAECSEFADEKIVENASFGGKDIKAVSKSAFIALSKKTSDTDITGVFFKFTAEDSDYEDEAVPAVSAVDESESAHDSKSADTAVSIDEPVCEEPEIIDENKSEIPVLTSQDEEEYDDGENRKKPSGSKLKTLIPFIILLLLVAGACAYFIMTKDKDDKPTVPDVPSNAVNATVEDESVTARGSTVTEKETTTEKETAAKNETTTKRAGETTKRRTQSERTTERRTQAQTTKKPTETPTTEKPTEAPAETTTKKTTEAPADTTAAPTTEAPTAPVTRVTDQGNNEKPDV